MTRGLSTQLTCRLPGISPVVAAMLLAASPAAFADADPVPACDASPARRPAVMFNRWQEDWSALANPCVPHKPFDDLKYIPLGGDPQSYLSLGANLRERMESNNAALFGIGRNSSDTYVIQRAEVSADARLAGHWQFFVQLEDARAFGKNVATPVDKNPLDLEQAFVTYVGSAGPGTVKFRVGRQEMGFDLQRFVAVRDGPNVRQAFDAVWADYELQQWRFIGFASQPVQNRDVSAFDDVSNRNLRFSGVRFERRSAGPGDLSGYYARYSRNGATYLDAAGNERRNVFDLRYTGKTGRADWDVESMLQTGRIGADTIRAWAVGSLAGYTFDAPWTPRVGVQIDAASGDSHPGDGTLRTFNPLFPNGYYFTLSGYTGYQNLIHVKPSITLKPASNLSLLAALGFQWRQTTADAVYQQGNQAVPGTAGHGSLWTGMYMQLRADWTIAANLVGSVEAVHFQVGNAIREAGGRNADYLAVELKYGW